MMNAEKPFATISAVLLIILFLSNYVPLLPVFCNDMHEGNQLIELGYCPPNHQKNFIGKFNNKPKEKICCCAMAPQFSAVATQHLNDLQSTFQVIPTKFYSADNPNKGFYIQETDTFGFLDHPLHLSYQVFLI